MQTKQLKANGRIRVARTEIDVPDRGKTTTFAYPVIGPDYYQNVMDEISEQGLSRPTTAQTFSLISLALENPDDEHCKDILSKLRNNYLWTSTENLYTPDEIIVYDNIDGNMPSDRETLLKRHKDGDKAVRVVNYDFERESQPVSDLINNPYIKAQVGDLPLEIVEQVATKISKRKSYVWALDKQSKDTKKYTALDSDWDDGGLYVGGYYHAYGRYGYVFGVCSSAEGTSQKSK